MKKFLHPQKSEKGQVLVLVAISLLALIAVIGLAIDAGYTYVSYARLRRAVDAAALGASSQIRQNVTKEGLEKIATEYLALNEVDATTLTLEVCTDASLIADEPRCSQSPPPKLVRVHANATVPLFFMGVLGFQEMEIGATATSEAASLDVMLVIDTSDSMTYDGTTPSQRDPYQCNYAGSDFIPGECQPFESVKDAAYKFLDNMYFVYDRVGIVTFDRSPATVLELTNDETMVRNAVKDLKVFEGGACPFPNNLDPASDSAYSTYSGACRLYNTPGDTSTTYVGFFCPIQKYNINHSLPATIQEALCYNTNSGGGLALAVNAFNNAVPFRNESLWVVIFLTDGAANLAYDPDGDPYCPDAYIRTNCRDGNPSNDHRIPPKTAVTYDADDYARTIADILIQQDAIIFSIGLGGYSTSNAEAIALLEYTAVTAAENADKPERAGVFYTAPSPSQLRQIFAQIASKIAIKIAR
jgi:Mg-chelatase subunit ChlD